MGCLRGVWRNIGAAREWSDRQAELLGPECARISDGENLLVERSLQGGISAAIPL